MFANFFDRSNLDITTVGQLLKMTLFWLKHESWVSYCSEQAYYGILDCDIAWYSRYMPTFREDLPPPSSEWNLETAVSAKLLVPIVSTRNNIPEYRHFVAIRKISVYFIFLLDLTFKFKR